MTDLMIPGGYEPRLPRTPAQPQPRQAPAPEPAHADPPADAPDRARIEREREGGGAPSERKPRRVLRWPM